MAAFCSALGTVLLILVVVAAAPAAVPRAFGLQVYEVISGSKVAVTQAITSAVIGEMMGAKAGLGYLLTNGAEMYDLNMILSSIFLLSLLGLLLYEACQIVEHRVLYWK